MRDAAADFCAILEAAGLGLTRPPGGASLYIGLLPEVDDVAVSGVTTQIPAKCVAIVPVGGEAPESYIGQGRKTLRRVKCQVQIRGDRRDLAGAQTLANGVYDALHLATAAPYVMIRASEGHPVPMPVDGEDRPRWVMNVEGTYQEDLSAGPVLDVTGAADRAVGGTLTVSGGIDYAGGVALRPVAGDNYARIQGAIDRIASEGGGEVQLAAGRWGIGTSPVLKKGVWLVGTGWGRTGLSTWAPTTGAVLYVLADIDGLRIAAGANGAGVERLSIHYPGTAFYDGVPSASTKAGVRFTTATDETTTITEGVVLRNIDVMGMGQAVFGPWVDGQSADIAQYMYMRFEAVHAARCRGGIIMAGVADMVFSDCHVSDCFGLNISTILPKVGPIASRDVGATPSPVPSTPATNLIQDLGNSKIDKFAAYACGGDGLVLIDCIATTVDAGAFNSSGRHGLYIIGSGNQTRILNSRIALNGGDGLHITTSTNRVQGLVFGKNRVEGNQLNGVAGAPGTGLLLDAIDIETCDIVDNGLGAAEAYDNLALQAGRVRIRGGSLGCFGGAPQVRYAFNGDFAGTDYWTLRDVDCQGISHSPNWVFAGAHLVKDNCPGLT